MASAVLVLPAALSILLLPAGRRFRKTEKRPSDQTSPGAVAPSAARETLSAADRVAGNRTSWRQADVVRSWPLTRIQTRYCATSSRPLPVALRTNAASGRPGRGKQLLDHLRGEGVTVLSSTDCVDSSPAALTRQSVGSSTPGALPSKRPPSEQAQRRPLSMRPNADVPVAEWWMGSTGTTWSTPEGASVGSSPTLALTNRSLGNGCGCRSRARSEGELQQHHRFRTGIAQLQHLTLV